ncbi:MAG: efflux RND transporter periplasmic adaptor subunit [Hyphomicrobium sp.]|nr:efflux RND transporter periplasmic adaptor subunit [Hyphomicrobium sp.]
MSSVPPISPVLRANLLAVLAGLAVAGCNAEADVPSATRPQAVETVTVKLEPAGRTWSYVGTVKPRYQSDLGFRVGGKIIDRSVEVGSWTKKGDVIARLDPSDFELALAAQEAELAAAQVGRDETVAALERFRVLFRDGHVAQAALDQRQSATAEARSRVERALRNVELARNQLAYSTLVADSDGVVTSLPVEVGQVVAPGQLIARVARGDAIEVEVALPEQDVAAAREAMAEADLWGNRGSRVAATLREVAPDADPVSRTYRARFALTNFANSAPDFGRTASLYLRARSAGFVAKLPISAIANENGKPVAWVVSDDGRHAVARPVTILAYERDGVLVSEGLANGDRVVALGVHMLDADKTIRPIEARALVSQK